MRDPKRIDPFLAELKALWEQYPDYRFGQLVMNLMRPGNGEPGFLDPWEWEEERWLDLMRNYPHTYAKQYENPLDAESVVGSGP